MFAILIKCSHHIKNKIKLHCRLKTAVEYCYLFCCQCHLGSCEGAAVEHI